MAAESGNAKGQQLVLNPDQPGPGPGQGVFRLMTWNIDGLDERNVQERTLAVCDTICKFAPDVIYLQEVVPSTQTILELRLSSRYEVITGGQQGYFVCMLVKKGAGTRVTQKEIQPFVNTKMLRNLLVVKIYISRSHYLSLPPLSHFLSVSISPYLIPSLSLLTLHSAQAVCKNVYLSLLNTHLESTAQGSAERLAQFQLALGEMQMADPDRVVIFGGDTNLRDKEVAGMGGLPHGTVDLWEASGANPQTKFTWDTTTNDNLSWDAGRFKPKIRFDRLFLRPAAGHSANLSIRSFELVGKERLPSCGRFPSDHWGILCDFDILPAEV